MRRRDFLWTGVGVSCLGLAASADPFRLCKNERLAWPGGAKAAVSLTYDDGLDSQLDNVVPALRRLDLKATFFLVEENVAARVEDWRAVGEAGHEIGNHTVHHPCQLRSATSAEFDRQEVEGMETFMAGNFDKGRVPIFAYPCGKLDLGRGGVMEEQLRYVRLLKEHFVAARAADGEPNDPRTVQERRYVLQATAPTYDRDDPKLAIDYVRSALATGDWAILIFHEVTKTRRGAGDTSLRSHEMVLNWLKSQPVWCAPMGAVLRHLSILQA
jgi:peptidoglycan/xylan/chitin deacetylase (PgdA/CDA1 family)